MVPHNNPADTTGGSNEANLLTNEVEDQLTDDTDLFVKLVEVEDDD